MQRQDLINFGQRTMWFTWLTYSIWKRPVFNQDDVGSHFLKIMPSLKLYQLKKENQRVLLQRKSVIQQMKEKWFVMAVKIGLMKDLQCRTDFWGVVFIHNGNQYHLFVTGITMFNIIRNNLLHSVLSNSHDNSIQFRVWNHTIIHS